MEVSMLEAMAEWMGYPMYFAMDGAEPPVRAGAGHATIFPYGPYDTADGTVMLGLQNDREWDAFCRKVLKNDAMAEDPRYRGNDGRFAHQDIINAEIYKVFGVLSTADTIERLEGAGIGTANVNSMDGLWEHEQLKARNRWQDIQSPAGPLPALKPVSGDSWEPKMDPVPALGSHTRSILSELGYDQQEISQIVKDEE